MQVCRAAGIAAAGHRFGMIGDGCKPGRRRPIVAMAPNRGEFLAAVERIVSSWYMPRGDGQAEAGERSRH